MLCSASFPRKDAAIEEKSTFIAPSALALGKERLYDRTLKALVLADMSLSQHSQATFPRQ